MGACSEVGPMVDTIFVEHGSKRSLALQTVPESARRRHSLLVALKALTDARVIVNMVRELIK